MTRAHLLLVAVVAALTLGAVACGEDDGDRGATDPAATAGDRGDAAAPAAPPPRKRVKRADRPACEALRESDVAQIVEKVTGRPLTSIGRVAVERMDSDEISNCGYFAGPHDDVAIRLIIDRALNAQKRYWYRMEEQNQRTATGAKGKPRLIRGVGQDKTYGGAGAFWTPSLSRLTAYRDDRMLTVVFFVPHADDRTSSAAAASLAKTAYRRLFGDRPPAPPTSLAGRYPHP